MSETRIVEINGVKMEVDLRKAVTIDTYKVGDTVKVLIPGYGNDFKSHAGAIIGFDDFKSMPTIVVAYLDAQFSEAEIKLAYIHNESKVELTHAAEGDVPFSKEQVLESLGKIIAKKQAEVDQANWHKTRFLQWFGKYFDATAEEEEIATALSSE